MIELTGPIPSANFDMFANVIDLHCILPWTVDGDEVGELHRRRRFYNVIIIDDASAEIHRQQMNIQGNWIKHHRKRQIQFLPFHVPEKDLRLDLKRHAN